MHLAELERRHVRLDVVHPRPHVRVDRDERVPDQHLAVGRLGRRRPRRARSRSAAGRRVGRAARWISRLVVIATRSYASLSVRATVTMVAWSRFADSCWSPAPTCSTRTSAAACSSSGSTARRGDGRRPQPPLAGLGRRRRPAARGARRRGRARPRRRPRPAAGDRRPRRLPRPGRGGRARARLDRVPAGRDRERRRTSAASPGPASSPAMPAGARASSRARSPRSRGSSSRRCPRTSSPTSPRTSGAPSCDARAGRSPCSR